MKKEERVELYLKTAKKIDPQVRVMADELRFLEASGFMEFNDEKVAKAQWDIEQTSLRKKFEGLSKENLITLLIEANLTVKKEMEEADRLNKIISFLRSYFDIARVSYLKNSNHLKKGVNASNKLNNDALLECMNELINKIQREPLRTDFLAFVNIVQTRFPSQPKSKASRVSKKEGIKTISQKKSVASEADESKSGWPMPSLRKFFEECTGTKPTTLKK